MDIVGDQIVRVFHAGGIELDGAVVDNYAILLKSGRCIAIDWEGIVPADQKGMSPDPTFDWCIGMTIIAVEKSEHGPTVGIRLSCGSQLYMGSPVPYFWGLWHT